MFPHFASSLMLTITNKSVKPILQLHSDMRQFKQYVQYNSVYLIYLYFNACMCAHMPKNTSPCVHTWKKPGAATKTVPESKKVRNPGLWDIANRFLIWKQLRIMESFLYFNSSLLVVSNCHLFNCHCGGKSKVPHCKLVAVSTK